VRAARAPAWRWKVGSRKYEQPTWRASWPGKRRKVLHGLDDAEDHDAIRAPSPRGARW